MEFKGKYDLIVINRKLKLTKEQFNDAIKDILNNGYVKELLESGGLYGEIIFIGEDVQDLNRYFTVDVLKSFRVKDITLNGSVLEFTVIIPTRLEHIFKPIKHFNKIRYRSRCLYNRTDNKISLRFIDLYLPYQFNKEE